MDVEKIAVFAGVGFALAVGAFVLWGPSPKPRRRGEFEANFLPDGNIYFQELTNIFLQRSSDRHYKCWIYMFFKFIAASFILMSDLYQMALYSTGKRKTRIVYQLFDDSC